MAIPLRHADPANITAGIRTFFVTSSIAGKRRLLQSERSAKLFIDVIYRYREQHRYRLHQFVVMPDHFHVLITVGPEISVERAVQFIKGGFAFRAGKAFGFRPPVWERGFSEVRVNSSEAAERIARYIVENPVRAGWVQTPADYLYCSANPGFVLDDLPQGLKAPNQLGNIIGTSEDVP